MHKNILLSLCLLAAGLCTNRLPAQTLTAVRNAVAESYPCWLYEPPTDSLRPTDSISKPLVVFLHGHSLSGTDLQRVRRYGTIAAIEMGLLLDAFVLAPQTYNGWDAHRVWQLVEWTTAQYPVDTNRIYLLGMSMGGYGTINTATLYADKIAAAMALCGGGTLKDYCSLQQVPLWIMHGTADKSVSISESDKVVNLMAACGDTTRLIYNRMPGLSHGALARVFYLQETYDWLLSHSLQDSARTVNRNYTINSTSLNNAYAHLRGPKPQIAVTAPTPVVSVADSSATNSSEAESSSATTSTTYKVRQGDTLWSIARRNNTTVQKLCSLNSIRDTDVLCIGKILKIK